LLINCFEIKIFDRRKIRHAILQKIRPLLNLKWEQGNHTRPRIYPSVATGAATRSKDLGGRVWLAPNFCRLALNAPLPKGLATSTRYRLTLNQTARD
jgi:hypothetical protein